MVYIYLHTYIFQKGGTYTSTGMLYLTDFLTFKDCSFPMTNATLYSNEANLKCSSKPLSKVNKINSLQLTLINQTSSG